MNLMNLEITICANGRYWNGGAKIRVPDPMIMAFEPLKSCDDTIMAMATGDILAASEELKTKLTIRKDAAEYLATTITKYLLGEMSKNDTHNGYSVKQAKYIPEKLFYKGT